MSEKAPISPAVQTLLELGPLAAFNVLQGGGFGFEGTLAYFVAEKYPDEFVMWLAESSGLSGDEIDCAIQEYFA